MNSSLHLAGQTRSLNVGRISHKPIMASLQALSSRLRRAARAPPSGVWQPASAAYTAARSLTTTTRAAADDAAPSAAPEPPGSGSPRVCILGGGFGGLYTAVKLESLIWPKGKKPKVTLIDQGERFVFKPLLYELLNGTAQPWEVAPTFAQLLAPYPIQFVQSKVAGVEPDQALAGGGSATGGRVLLEGGAAVEYDWLVVALGAESDPRGVPGVKELARPFVTLEDATFVKDRLADLEAAAAAGGIPAAGAAAGAEGGLNSGRRSPVVVVVGAGYAGVELCSVIGERLRGTGVGVRLVTPADDILMGSPEGQRDAARKALSGLGVTLMTGTKVDRLTAAGGGGGGGGGDEGRCVVHLEGPAGGEEMEADLVVWTAGSAPVSKFGKSLPFPSNAAGAIETDPTLRVRMHARVFALGDVSGSEPPPPAGQQPSNYPATAQVAFQQADYAAWNVWAAINGRPLLPFRYQHLGSMMSLGAANAAVALPLELPAALASSIKGTPLDSLLSIVGVDATAQGGVTLEGPLAQLLRRAAYLYRQPTGEQRLSVAASWVQQAAEVAARAAQELSERVQQQPTGVGGDDRRS